MLQDHDESAGGADRGPAERLVDLAAERADIDLDEVDVGVRGGGVLPDRVEDVALADRVAGPVGQLGKHGEPERSRTSTRCSLARWRLRPGAR
jgi:hypothetical protein